MNALPHPGNVIPDRQVRQVLIVDIAGHLFVLIQTVREIRELTKKIEATDQIFFIGSQTGPNQPLPRRHVGREAGPRQCRQQWIAYQLSVLAPGLDLARIVGDLFQENGSKIHYRPGVRIGLQMSRHVHVILDPVEIDPGQLVFAVMSPPVIGLVHMPA